MIVRAKARGYVTYDELNKVLPSDKTSSEQIEDTMSMLNEMGINVIESEEQEEQAEGEVPRACRDRQGSRRQARHRDRAVRPHRRSRAHVSARDGQRRAAQPRRRDRDRQAHRGRPRADDRRAVRVAAHLRGADRVARRIERRQGPSARHHRSGSDLWRRPRRPGRRCRCSRRRRQRGRPRRQAAAAADGDPGA